MMRIIFTIIGLLSLTATAYAGAEARADFTVKHATSRILKRHQHPLGSAKAGSLYTYDHAYTSWGATVQMSRRFDH